MWVVRCLGLLFGTLCCLSFSIYLFGNCSCLSPMNLSREDVVQECQALTVGLLFTLSWSVLTIWCAVLHIIVHVCIVHGRTAMLLDVDPGD